MTAVYQFSIERRSRFGGTRSPKEELMTVNKLALPLLSRRAMLRLAGVTAAAGAASAAGVAGFSAPASAKSVYDVGADDKEIRIGQTVPFSGPASYVGVSSRVQLAYFERLNKQGGVNGRQVRLLALDDAYSPPKTVEATRRLVESEQVLAMFGSTGTACQIAVQKYLNSRKIPQLLIGTGAARFNNPKEFPWTTPGSPLYASEARALARYAMRTSPNATIAILYQMDDLGREYASAFRDELGDRAKAMIVTELSYEMADPTVDSQVLRLASTNASVFLNFTVGKFVAQSLRKVRDTSWRPTQYLMGLSSTAVLLKPAGEGAKDVMGMRVARNVSSPRWQSDPAVQDYYSLLDAYLPNLDKTDNVGFGGYSMAILLQKLLTRCGDNLTRENLLKIATNLTEVVVPLYLPGMSITTTPEDYAPLKIFELSRFENDDWTAVEKLS